MPSHSFKFLSFVRAYWTDEYGQSGGWNIVDVPDGQGILRCGLVVGKSESGLLVDFFCEGQPPRIIEYGKLFRCDDHLLSITNTESIQVLVRIRNDLPFTWLDAKLLDGNTCLTPSRLVEVQFPLDGVAKREIVHTSQIRCAVEQSVSKNFRVVNEDYFGTDLCPLPDKYVSSISESSALWKMSSRDLYESYFVHSMRVRNGSMEYLHCTHHTWFPKLKINLDSATQHMERCAEIGLIWTGRSFIRAPVTLQSSYEESSALSSLPAELFIETLRFLDSVDRVRVRRVSVQWDAILSMETVFDDVWVGLNFPYDCPFRWTVWEGLHAVVLVLSKLMTKSTKWIIVAGSEDDNSCQDTEVLVRLVCEIARHSSWPCAGKLKLVISECKWSPGRWDFLSKGLARLAGLCTDLASICTKLVLKNCKADLSDGCGTVVLWGSVVSVRRGVIETASPTLEADLWEMLNNNVSGLNLEEISSMLAQLKGEYYIEGVKTILQEFHCSDPRLETRLTLYRSDELTGMNCNELDIWRLTQLTQCALERMIMVNVFRRAYEELGDFSDDDEK